MNKTKTVGRITIKVAKRSAFAGHLTKHYIFDDKAKILCNVIWSGRGYVIINAEKVEDISKLRLSEFPYRRSRKDWREVLGLLYEKKE